MNESVAKNIAPSTLKYVKETVDLIYELTSAGEYKGGWEKESSRFRRIATILVKRGSLIKEGHVKSLSYRWNPLALAPTKVFYASVAAELIENQRRYGREHRQRAKQALLKQRAAQNPPAMPEVLTAAPDSALDMFTIQQLWDELKRRGCSIEDNRLVLIKREVFE